MTSMYVCGYSARKKAAVEVMELNNFHGRKVEGATSTESSETKAAVYDKVFELERKVMIRKNVTAKEKHKSA